MPDIPYPLQTDEFKDFQTQVLDIVRDIYENRIGGAMEGDVFKVSGDVLELQIASGSALKKVNGKLDVDLSGASSGSAGLKESLFTAKGVLLVGKAKNTPVALPSSADGYVLRVDHSTESGLAWGNTINGLTITASTGTLTIAAGKTLTCNASITVTGTDSETLTLTKGLTVTTNAGTIAFGAASKTLTVEDNSLVNQDLTTDASPTFVTAKLSGLTDGKIPVHVDDATGLADGPTKTDVDDAVTKKHVAVTVSAPIALSGQALSLVNNAVSPGTITTVDIDGTLAGNSDVYVPTQKATKTYADLKLAKASNLSDVANAATAFTNIKQAATESATGVVELATNAETVAFSDTSRAITADDLGYVIQKSYNHVNYAKGQLLDRILVGGATNLVGTLTNIKGLWVFDQTGATSTITDRSGNSHDITLRDASLNAINASTCSPGVAGLARYLTFDATHLWNIPDHADFTFIEPQAFSIIVLANGTDLTLSHLFDKYSEKTGATQKEYLFGFNNADKLAMSIYDDSTNASLVRYYNTALTSYQGTPHIYAASYSGVAVVTNIKVYCDGLQIDDTSFTSGIYVAMEDKNANIGDYYLGTVETITAPFKGSIFVIIVIAEELSATQMVNWDRLLRSYAGVAL
jgi:hypothetical protein